MPSIEEDNLVISIQSAGQVERPAIDQIERYVGKRIAD